MSKRFKTLTEELEDLEAADPKVRAAARKLDAVTRSIIERGEKEMEMHKTQKKEKSMPTKHHQKSQKEILADKGYISASEVAQKVGRSLQTVYSWIDEKRIEAVRIDTHWYVKMTSLVSYYREQDPKAVELLGLKDA